MTCRDEDGGGLAPHPAAPRELDGAARRRAGTDRSDPPGSNPSSRAEPGEGGRDDTEWPTKEFLAAVERRGSGWRIQIASLAKVSDLQINKRK